MLAPDQAPYPGLRPFKRDETHLFFGRDECVNDMLVRLAATRFLAVLGSSGTGKSSLVKTGLLSSLEMGLLSGAGSRWRIVDFRPGSGPFARLACRLLETEEGQPADVSPNPADADRLRSLLSQGGPRALIEWCREGHLAEGTNLLLLVDQFEELFRYQDYAGREEAEAFVSLLLESRRPIEVESPHMAEFPIYIAITMRSEYLGACALIEGLAEAINEAAFLTPRMTRQQCEEAIVGPARVCGIEIEDHLVAKILNDLANFAPWEEGGEKDQLSRLAQRADQLPLMQHALNQMWRRARNRQALEQRITLKVDDYHGLEQELDDHAEQVLGSLGENLAPVVEAVFRAVTSGTTVANAVRRPTKYGDLVQIVNSNRGIISDVIAAFGPGACNFLTFDMPQTGPELPDEAIVDISHESLIRQWRRLSRWLAKEGEAAHDWQRLHDEAEKYLMGDRAHRGELLGGRRLANAVLLLQETNPTAAWAARYGVDLACVRLFLDKSRNARALRRASAVGSAAALVALLFYFAPWESFRLRQINAQLGAVNSQLNDLNSRLNEQVELDKNFHLAVVDQGKAIVNLLSDIIQTYRAEKKEMVSTRSAKLGSNEGQGGRAAVDTRTAGHAGQLDRGASAPPEENTESAGLKNFRERNRQLTGAISAIDRLFSDLMRLESGNVELIRSHMATLALLSVLRDDPYSGQGLEERHKAYEFANSLASMDLDFESVRTIYVSVTLLSLAFMDDGRYSEASEALDKVQTVLASFAGNASKTPQDRDRATDLIADIHARKCYTIKAAGELEKAVSECLSGLASLAQSPPQNHWKTIGDLHQALGGLYVLLAKNFVAASSEAIDLRKKAIVELRQSIKAAYTEFDSRFEEYRQKVESLGSWRAIISNLPDWSRKNFGHRIGRWLAEKDPGFALTRSVTIARRLTDLAEMYGSVGDVQEARVAYLLEFIYRYELASNKEIEDKANSVRAAIDELKYKGDPASIARAKSEEAAASELIGYDHDVARRRLAGALLDLAFFESQPNREQESADRLFNQCIELMSRVAERKSSKAPDQEALGYCHYGLGWLRQQRAESEKNAGRRIGLLRGARDANQKAAEFLERASVAPELERVPHFLNVTLRRLTFIIENLNDIPEALALADRAIKIAQNSYAKQQNEETAEDLVASELRKGDLLKSQGQLEGALAAYAAGRMVRKAMVDRDASKSGWQRDLAVLDDKVGDLLGERSKFDEALDAYRDGNSIFNALVAQDPTNTLWQRDLSFSYNLIGGVLKRQDKLDEALAAYRVGLAIRKALVAKEPNNIQWRRDLSLSNDNVGDVLKAQGKLDEALAAYRDGLAIDRALAEQDPSRTDLQRDLSISYRLIGDVLKAQGKLDEALAAYRDGLAIRKPLAERGPNPSEFQRDLSFSYDAIGLVLKAQNKLDEALAAYRDGLAIRKALVAKEPNNIQWRRDLELAVDRIGGLSYALVLASDFAKALETADQAISLAPDKIWLYSNRAHALMFLGRIDEARALYLKYRGEMNAQDQKSWETVVLGDFTELHKAPLSNPLMDEIEKLFAGKT